MVADIGLDVDLGLEMTALSGGQAARVGLAALLLSRYDVYLLDEPTNDLDPDGLDLLEEFVQGLEAPVVVVSHDREFLARTVTSPDPIPGLLREVNFTVTWIVRTSRRKTDGTLLSFTFTRTNSAWYGKNGLHLSYRSS